MTDIMINPLVIKALLNHLYNILLKEIVDSSLPFNLQGLYKRVLFLFKFYIFISRLLQTFSQCFYFFIN